MQKWSRSRLQKPPTNAVLPKWPAFPDGRALPEETECLGPATAMKVLEAIVLNPTLLDFDRKAREVGRPFVDRTVAVGAVTQADGFAEWPSTSNHGWRLVLGGALFDSSARRNTGLVPFHPIGNRHLPRF